MSNEPYHYTECGLDNVWLVDGFTVMETPYGKGVSICHQDGLHKCIARDLVDKPEPLTGAEFRFLRIELDLSQRLIGELFGRTERQVRTWEQAHGKPVDRTYDRLIRLIYTERQRPDTTFEGLYERLRKLDKRRHAELRLKATRTGWRKSA